SVAEPTVGGDHCLNASTTTVYHAITADGKTEDAPDERLWVAVKLVNIPQSYFDGTIYVRAYVTDAQGTRYSDAKVITVWGANAIEYHSNWDYATRNANDYSIQNPDYKENNDYKTFGVKEDVKKLYNDKTPVRYFPNENNNYAGNDLLIEFSFLYNDTMSNASDGTLTVMYIQNNNVFNINLKTGLISNNERNGDVVLYKADDSGNIPIGGYGWHRFGVRVHQVPINDNGVEDYQIIATAYLDGEKILEVDKTAYTKTKTGSYTGKLYELIPYTNRMIYDKVSKNCDAYVMIEKIYKSSANAGYLVLQDLSFSCGQTFQQQVTKVADPVSRTYRSPDGTTMTGDVYFAAAEAHEHVWDGEFTITKQPTLLENGWKSEHCSVCGAGHAVVATPSEMTPVVINGKDETAPAGWGSGTDFYASPLLFQDIAKEEGHFYPTNSNPSGKDYLVEFSILWNSTLRKGSKKTFEIGHFSGGTKDRTTIWLHLDDKDNDCPYTGGIDLSNGDGGTTNQSPANPAVSGDGWHRIGLRYHQTAAIENEKVVYTLTYSVYVDGNKVAEVIGSALRYADEKYLLYTATIDDGKLKYSDNTESRYYTWIHANGFFNFGSDKYLVLADLMTSAGHDFMQRVEKAASPTASPINLGWYDEELVYYKLAD
ncbi:MAG: hypothetical protein IK090_08690, partial [Clostridia bacterium]|nr:hypothetical protein [Clostridia bacterium]